MTFDAVHDSQAVHRALVRAFSFPGVPVSLGGPASRWTDPRVAGALGAVALTLLDPETTFSHPDPGVLTELTGARRRDADQAAFVLLPGWDEAAWTQAFHQARVGTLLDPHTGATVIGFADEGTPGSRWTASGPGIEHPLDLTLPGRAWVEARNQACREFPLGVDVLWVRGTSVVALPRTTRLSAEKEA